MLQVKEMWYSWKDKKTSHVTEVAFPWTVVVRRYPVLRQRRREFHMEMCTSVQQILFGRPAPVPSWHTQGVPPQSLVCLLRHKKTQSITNLSSSIRVKKGHYNYVVSMHVVSSAPQLSYPWHVFDRQKYLISPWVHSQERDLWIEHHT